MALEVQERERGFVGEDEGGSGNEGGHAAQRVAYTKTWAAWIAAWQEACIVRVVRARNLQQARGRCAPLKYRPWPKRKAAEYND